MKVPVYEQQVGTPAALPGYEQNLRVTPEDYGAGIGEGMQRIAEGGAQVAQLVHKVRAEQGAVVQQDAWSQLAEHGRQLLDDPTNGFKRQVGKEAMANHESVVTDFDAKVKQISSGMSGDAQRVFLQNADKLRSNFMDEVDNHTAKQIAVNDEQVHQATVSGAGNNVTAVGLSFDDPALASRAMSLGLNPALHAVETKGQRLGWTPEMTDLEKKKTATDIYTTTIDAMLEAGQAGKAKVVLSDFVASGMADAGILAQKNTQKNVDAGAIRGEAQALADEVWRSALPKNDKGEPTSIYGDPAVAEADLRSREIKDQALFDQALQNIKARGSSEAAARKESDSPRLGRLEQKVYGGSAFTTADDDFVRLSDEGKADALRIQSAELARRGEHGAARRREQTETDKYLLSLFDGLDQVGDTGKDKVSIDIDSGPFLDGSRTLREQIRARQKSAQTAVAKDRGVSAQEFKAQVEDKLSQSSLSKSDKDGVRKYVNGVYSHWLNDQKNAGVPPPPEVVDKWFGDWFMVKPKPWYQRDTLGVQDEMKQRTPSASSAKAVTPPAGAPSGSTRITNGTQFGWLHPDVTMPAGWRAAQ